MRAALIRAAFRLFESPLRLAIKNGTEAPPEEIHRIKAIFDNNSVKLGLIVENNLVNTSNPISSKAVKTEVDNITSLIGKINMILNYVNTGVKPESL